MSDPTNEQSRVLAIDPTSRGFGFVVFEGPQRLIDWGVAHVRSAKHTRSLERIEALLDRYTPAVVVVEDNSSEASRRCARVRELLSGIIELASSKKVRCQRFSRRAVKGVFSECRAVTKDQIATVIAWRFPELAPRLPPARKPWMSEDERMSIFDATALSLTFFHFRSKRKGPQ